MGGFATVHLAAAYEIIETDRNESVLFGVHNRSLGTTLAALHRPKFSAHHSPAAEVVADHSLRHGAGNATNVDAWPRAFGHGGLGSTTESGHAVDAVEP
jgi:hypothetical protein